MFPWWAVILVSFGFTIWSIFCVIVGAAISMNAKKQLNQTQPNPKMN
jgi:hypothetical protein